MEYTEEIRNNPRLWVSWILQCGCCPMEVYCSGCDGRRKICAQWEKEDKERALVKACEELGYKVTKCS